MNDRIRLLVVDDEEVIRELFVDMLEPEGYEVITASCGAEAVELVKWEDFDLILLDVRMPGMDGLQTFEAIKRIKGDCTPPALIVTGYAKEELLADAIKKGVQGYIYKPFRREVMLQVVEKVLRKGALRK